MAFDYKKVFGIAPTSADAIRRLKQAETSRRGQAREYGDIYLPSRKEQDPVVARKRVGESIRGLSRAKTK